MRPRFSGALAVLLLLPLSGCVGEDACTYWGPTHARYEIGWRANLSAGEVERFFLDRDWERAEGPGGSIYAPSPQPEYAFGLQGWFRRPLNETTALSVKWLAYDSGVGPHTSLSFIADNSTVASADEAEATLGRHLGQTLEALISSFGDPEYSAYKGGNWHCGAL
jgi:hypothetical protein